jgi:hypothetical protein
MDNEGFLDVTLCQLANRFNWRGITPKKTWILSSTAVKTSSVTHQSMFKAQLKCIPANDYHFIIFSLAFRPLGRTTFRALCRRFFFCVGVHGRESVVRVWSIGKIHQVNHQFLIDWYWYFVSDSFVCKGRSTTIQRTCLKHQRAIFVQSAEVECCVLWSN